MLTTMTDEDWTIVLQVFQKLSDLQFQRLVNLALIVSGIALALK